MLIRRLFSISLLYFLDVSEILADVGSLSDKPKDYAQSFTDSRVGELVNFFELMHKSSQSATVSKNTNVVLTLGEAASKLYTLVHGQPLELKCDKYIKLLSRPNIRTIATIRVLIKESQSFNEINQRDSNLMAKLVSEREFDALARIQTILQTLETERVMGKSNLEPNVEKNLLDCVSYYIYRHQRATSDIIKHVRDSLDKLPNSLIASAKQEVTLRKLAEAVDNIRAIEEDKGHFRLEEWIVELKIIHQFTLENDFELPEKVQDFLTDPKRVERLHLIDRGEELKARLLQLETSSDLAGACEIKKYVGTLKNLQDICNEFTQIIPEDTCTLVKDPKRQNYLEPNRPPEKPEKSSQPIKTSETINSKKESVNLPFEKPLPVTSLKLAKNDVELNHEASLEPEKFGLTVPAINALPVESHELDAPISPAPRRPVILDDEELLFLRETQPPKKRKKKSAHRTRKFKDGVQRAAQQIYISKVCADLLRRVEMFFVNFRGVNTNFSDIINGATKLSRFRFGCANGSEAAHNLLESRLRSWCKVNHFLEDKRECRSLIDWLDELGNQEEEYIQGK